ncbi:baseplate J/gp47 family protein [Pasteurella skyensis]|uniref:Baseplate J/gp47 family protein n=1 Tax=Phocoenobacter skyensis TaxID=97481 RepID=A0AAJ6P1F7_9PAST|nr:baseplate J/gp47 family protein [Pasteurella skyensis]MDP8173687.1 baseplate J/gp47 family protein [Pasteurella skyensis]MDP8178055.1 baseplate J/gp47 family protein [Pasteurella skyensis]
MQQYFREILATSGLPVEEHQIKEKFDDLTQQEGFITNTSRMSPFWRLITAIAIAPVKWLTDILINAVLPNLFVKTASGKWLDLKVWGVGITRKPATKAQGYITFTKKDPSAVVTVEKGTVIQTERINNIIYKVITDKSVTIPSGVASFDILATAEHEGEAYNLAGGYYSILPNAVPGILVATNSDEWLVNVGTEQESDHELRQRYRVQFASVGQHHIDNVYRSMIAKCAGLSVDRIYFKHEAPRGAGTANAYLLLDTGVTSQPFVNKVNSFINDEGNHGHGDDLICYPMPETRHNVSCILHFDSNLGIQEREINNIVEEVENIIRCAFRENKNYNVTKTYPFDRFSWSNLGKELHQKFSLNSIEWGQEDIVSKLSIPRLETLSVRAVYD